MEEAIIINRSDDLKHWSKRYARIYFGNEICPRLFPNRKEVDTVLKFTKDKKLRITLLTSWVDSETLDPIRKMIKYIINKKALDEVVVNDYGIMHHFNKQYSHCRIVLGRAITSSVYGYFPDNFFYKMGIRRVECNDIEKVKILSRDCFDLKISYYHPYSIISTSRYCPVADITQNKLENHGITKCSKECVKMGKLKLYNSVFTKPAILKGNTQFIKNGVSLKSLNRKYVDRLVFQP